MARLAQPTNLELQALTVLWHRGPSVVAEIHEALPDGKARAYTTVLTVIAPQRVHSRHRMHRGSFARCCGSIPIVHCLRHAPHESHRLG